MKQIAIYGKGGIGKSTIAANLSAALALKGARVLQIGCDPKHDSTRLLSNGTAITTALDYLRHTRPDERHLRDVVHTGFKGVHCVEAGGPEPGVGCAGRGILSTFELLAQLGLQSVAYDIALYDVLGDVVCGGFAVPLRRDYANAVYIVTSGEFMSIYAANNILRGVQNYDSSETRLGGLILNRRGVEDEDERVIRFAEAAHLPIAATFPRSDQFTRAERLGKTVVEAFPTTPLAGAFGALAHVLLNSGPYVPAQPLADDDLERVVLGSSTRTVNPYRHRALSQPADATPQPALTPVPQLTARYLSKSVRQRDPLQGCAFAGAVHTTLHIQDAITIAHGPRSCSHIAHQTFTSSARRALTKYGVSLQHQFEPPLASSDMSESVVIFGGTDELESAIRAAATSHPPVIFVVTTCPAGIIGDDIQVVIERLPDVTAHTRIIPILTDGNINGDYSQGLITACLKGAAALLDPDVTPEDDTVNIVAEKNLANNTEANFRVIHDLLAALGLRVNCRFIRATSVDELRHFKRGRLNLLAYDDAYGRTFRDYLAEQHGAVFASAAFPVGFHETVQWLHEIAAFFAKTEQVNAIVAQHRTGYEALVENLRPALAGKRIFILTYGHRLDWILQTAFDLEMEVLKVAVLNYAYDDRFFSRFEGRFAVELNYAPEQRNGDIQALQPDLVLSNFMLGVPEGVRGDIIPICPDVGFHSGLLLAERWYRLLKAPVSEGWRSDASLL
ncbi:MAG: AAA family ATPase [Chloroflexi bacterium]|nr:AAA family ATPase [Chloroflexota bacterium]